jgi:kynurenine formamidase
VADVSLSAAEFRSLYNRLRTQHPAGTGDRVGTLSLITPECVRASAGQVRLGRSASMAARFEHEPSADNPEPTRHHVNCPPTGATAPDGLAFALDTLSLHIHGDADSHIDALSHVVYDGTLYGDVAPEGWTPEQVGDLSIDAAGQGIVGRGVLLDIPRLRGTNWLEPGDHVTADDLIAAQQAQRVQLTEGDLLFVRVGHRARRSALGPWDAAVSRAGMHPAAIELIAQRGVAVLGSDGNNDTAPSSVEGVDFPVHVLAVRALGMPLLDYLRFEDLIAICESAGRWSFLCVIAPLRLAAGTGSPINPIAIL